MKPNDKDRSKRLKEVAKIDNDIFVVRLNKVLNNLDVPMGTIATDCGLSRDTIASYIREVRMPNAKTLMLLCKYLNVSADWLLGLTNERRPVW